MNATYDYDELWADTYGDMQEVGPTHRHMRRLLREVLGELDYGSVADIGCGAGHNVELLREGSAPRRLLGVDVSEEALARARLRDPDGEYLKLDVERERLEQSFDLVFSSLLLEHLPDDVAALGNMRAMTDRHLLVTTIAGDFERYRAWDEQVGHVRNYRRGELEGRLAETGFEVVKAIYWGFPFYSPIVRLMQNRATASATYGRGDRLAARVLDAVYFLNSRRRGDLLIALAKPR